MQLVIFDIDGTILDTTNTDHSCFIRTFKDLYQINLDNVDWKDYQHVTDWGLTIEIFQKWFYRGPTPNEIYTIKTHFKSLLKKHIHQITEVKKALSFIALLSTTPGIAIGFATGGWRETALLKCKTIGLDLNDFVCKSSNDHYNRAEIIKLVIQEAMDKDKIKKFNSISYFGDGIWDYTATKQLGINFIGVDVKNNNQLKNLGVKNIINNYAEYNKILRWI